MATTAGLADSASAPPRTRGGKGGVARLLRQVGPLRVAATLAVLLATFLLARYAWSLPYASDAEKFLYDLRGAASVPRTAQDDRIALVVYDDDTRIQTGRISPLDRLILARALARLDRLGPRAIGIDMLIDQATPEDPALIAALHGMTVPTYLGFATHATNPDNMPLPREHFLRDFLRRIDSPNVHPTSIRLLTDAADNVIRNWPDQPAGLPPLLSNALSGAHPEFRAYQGAIRFRDPLYRDEAVFPEITLQFLADPAIPDAALKSLVEGRYVLIGGDLDDVDQFKTPETRATGLTIAGLKVHAHMLAQLLDGVRYARVPAPPLWLAALCFAIGGAVTRLLGSRLWLAVPLFAAQAAIAAFLPFWIQAHGIDTQGLPVFGWAAGWLAAFVAVSMAMNSVGAKQKKIAQSALGKYLPRDIANEIVRDPGRLALHGEKRPIHALFTDLEGFTKLSHAIEPEMVAFLLNRYLDLLSDVVLRHGGTIDKFVGDAIVAFWGAPIARDDDADRAARAAVAMYEAGEAFRREVPEGVPPIGRTRVGLHCGEAIVGNFGGEGRIQYTALGDSMNLAARLESANKALSTRVLVSEPAIAGVTSVAFRPMGRVVVRGRATPIAVYEPVTNMVNADVTYLTALYDRFDQGDVSALQELEKYCEERDEDAAMTNLVYRLRKVGAGGSFVLE